ncbi:MAG: SufS family cysteine desulfurase [Thermoanaerobaculia bacterium]
MPPPSSQSSQVPHVPQALRPFEVEALRGDFPILARRVGDEPLAYLDNAATTQKPRPVLAAMQRFYENSYGSVARGVHFLSAESTRLYEESRARVARFIGAPSPDEIVFVRGTTEAANLVAWSFARPRLAAGDEILLTELEHHSNLVPWQRVCEERGARLVVVPVDENGEVDPDEFSSRLGARTRLATFAHVSNALGTVLPVAELTCRAHAAGVPVFLDGAQSAPHLPIDVTRLGCDFFAFSAHKIYGPTGIGALFGRRELLADMPPWQGGGGMIRSVDFDCITYDDPPRRFEAGTPAAAEAIGFAAALDYLDALDRPALERHEHELVAAAVAGLEAIPGVRIVGRPAQRAGVVSFVLDGVHAHDLGTILDHGGIAVRAGHHCAQPLMRRFGVPATVRASFALYNTRDEVSALVAGVERARNLFNPAAGAVKEPS